MKKLTAVGLALAISVWALPVMANDNINVPIAVPVAVDSTDVNQFAFANSFNDLLKNASFAGVINTNDIELKQVNVLKYSDVYIGNAKATANGGDSKITKIEPSFDGIVPASLDSRYGKNSSSDPDIDAKVKTGDAKAIAKTAIHVCDTMTTSSITGIYGLSKSGASANVNQATFNTVTAVANTKFDQSRR